MIKALLVLCLLAQAGEEDPTVKNEKVAVSDYLRKLYATEAEEYRFDHADGESLKLIDKPLMRWSMDNDWSGDVFAWTYKERPEVIGCILSGPSGEQNRLVFHEFHLLSEHPIARADLLTKRQWKAAKGLELKQLQEAPEPADSKARRLVQMRQLVRDFKAHMDADGEWELRLLPQPLLRYGDEDTDVIDGALFAYVWPKGTDPELLLMIECRKSATGVAWHYAPVRFSTRSLWLKLNNTEVWHVESHREPQSGTTDLPYTTAYARTIPKQPPENASEKNNASPE